MRLIATLAALILINGAVMAQNKPAPNLGFGLTDPRRIEEHYSMESGAVPMPIPRPRHGPRDHQEHANLYECLSAVARDEDEMDTCQGLEFNRCISEIIEASGNTGARAFSLCWTGEVREWLDLWAGMLESSLWIGEPLPGEVRTEREWQSQIAVLDHFATALERAADQCIRAAGGQNYPLDHIGPCLGEVYGPALLDAMQRTYPQSGP